MANPHVLVLMDTSPASEAALDNAVRLARHHHLELIALFVEDQDLIASAGHGFTREISLLSGQARPFDRETLLARLARQRQQIESRLAALDQLEQPRWRLEVVTGPVSESILKAALGAEWVVLGKAGWSAAQGGQLGATARQLVETSQCRLLLWQERTPPPRTDIVALLGDPADNDTVIDTARQLALATEGNIRLLLLPGVEPPSVPTVESGQQRASSTVTIERLSRGDIDALRHALQVRPAAALVIDDRAAAALNLPMTELIAGLDTPVIRLPTVPMNT